MEEIVGSWWRPDNPDDRLTGTLQIQDDGEMQLNLVGMFALASGQQSAPLGEVHDFLLGVGSGSHHVTLVNCLPSGGVIGTGPPTLGFSPQLALIGQGHLPNPMDARFPAATLAFTGLREWAIPTALGRTIDQDDQGRLRELVVSYTRPDPLVTELPFGSVALQNWAVFNLGHANVELEDTASFEIRAETGLTWNELMAGPVKSLQNLLTFSLEETCAIATFNLHVEVDGAVVPGGEVKLRPVFRQRAEAPSDSAYRTTKKVFTLRDVERDRHATIVQRWFELVASIPTVIDLHLAPKYGRMFLETRFQFAAQALETIHRELPEFDNNVRPKQDFKTWRVSILNQIASERDRETVRLSLRNDKSYRMRLYEILDAVPHVVAALGVRRVEFVDWVVELRNQIVHGEARKPEHDGAFLHHLCETMRWVLIGYLLQRLGFTEAEFGRIANFNSDSSLIQRWWFHEAPTPVVEGD